MQTCSTFEKDLQSFIYRDVGINVQRSCLFEIRWIVPVRYPCRNRTPELYFGQKKRSVIDVWLWHLIKHWNFRQLTVNLDLAMV